MNSSQWKKRILHSHEAIKITRNLPCELVNMCVCAANMSFTMTHTHSC